LFEPGTSSRDEEETFQHACLSASVILYVAGKNLLKRYSGE